MASSSFLAASALAYREARCSGVSPVLSICAPIFEPWAIRSWIAALLVSSSSFSQTSPWSMPPPRIDVSVVVGIVGVAVAVVVVVVVVVVAVVVLGGGIVAVVVAVVVVVAVLAAVVVVAPPAVVVDDVVVLLFLFPEYGATYVADRTASC